jgi:hypothetical protein
MSTKARSIAAAMALAASAALTGGVALPASGHAAATPDVAPLQFHLTPSSAQLAACMPNADVNVVLRPKTDSVGHDGFSVHATGLPPNTAFTTFLLQQAGAPFGAAEYIGDFTSDSHGRADSTFRLIVQEAFSSTLVGTERVRVDLNQIGVWFADPAGDDFCFGQNGGSVTPFDGDNAAGVQAFNSLNAPPLPAP